jgi:hypothetical protein
MRSMATHHRNENQYSVVYGYLLEEGDTLEATDVYDSSNGKWENCPCPGLIIGKGLSTKWIRPYKFGEDR